MFQSALVRRHLDGPKSFDSGQLAETLLFYSSVHILADRGLLADLITGVGENNLIELLDQIIELLDQKTISLTYSRAVGAIMAETTNHVTDYRFAFPQFGGLPGKRFKASDEIEEIVTRTLGASRKSRKYAQKIQDRVVFKNIGPDNAKDLGVLQNEVLNNNQFVKECVGKVIKILVPDYTFPKQWEFMVLLNDENFRILSDIDFEKINAIYRRQIPEEHSTITPAYVLAHILDAQLEPERKR